MRVIGMEKLEKFWKRHVDAEQSLSYWFSIVKNENWDKPAELTARFPNARVIGRGRAIFNIKGNRYRLVAEINYQRKLIQIRFVGTHAEYDRIEALEV